MTKKIFLQTIPFLLFAFLLNCASADKSKSSITYTAVEKNFSVAVTSVGVLDAKVNRSISVPQSLDYQKELSYIIPEGTVVEEGDTIAVMKDERLEREYENTLNEIEMKNAELKKKETELDEQRSQLESNLKIFETSAESKKLRLAELEFIAPTKQEIEKLEIEKFDIEAEKTRKKLVSLENVKKEEINSMQMKIKQIENKLKQYDRFKEQLTVKAPMDGIVVYEINRRTNKKNELGDMVRTRYPLVKIPDLSVMQVELQVSETDAQKLKTGQKAVVSVSSSGYFDLPGKVSMVDKIAKPVLINYRRSKVKMVRVTVDLDSTDIVLTPGLTAECKIFVEELENAIVVPKECVFEKDSNNVVYIKDGDKFEQRQVDLAYKGDDFIEIKNGVNNGEKLSLREPGSSQIK
ncbi:efflux RND transporter periplasmic adaptor subunit [candidate division KSB1 bacterium]